MDTFLGNDGLKQRLSTALAKGQLSHCYLLTGPVGSGKRTLAKYLAAAMQCTGTNRPCLQCPQCRKVLGGVHPDLITVDDPEKKIIPVKLVRDACADLYIRPNEGLKKIYLFPRAQGLNPQGQNTLLKCIEEPPAYGVFLLLAEHAEQLLPTIRSRCVELRLSPLPEALLRKELTRRFPNAAPESIRAAMERSGGYLGQAVTALEEAGDLLPQSKALAEALCQGSPGALLRVTAPMEKLKREQLLPILQQWQVLLAAALRCQCGQPALYPECAHLARERSAASLLSDAEVLRQAMELCEANVGTAHICGLLATRL